MGRGTRGLFDGSRRRRLGRDRIVLRASTFGQDGLSQARVVLGLRSCLDAARCPGACRARAARRGALIAPQDSRMAFWWER
jgi:hypothetical protein